MKKINLRYVHHMFRLAKTVTAVLYCHLPWTNNNSSVKRLKNKDRRGCRRPLGLLEIMIIALQLQSSRQGFLPPVLNDASYFPLFW